MLPQDFLSRMREMLGDEYPAFLESYSAPRYHALRFNPLKGSREVFAAHSPFHLTPVEWETNGFYYETADAPGKHPYHSAGVYYIQEPSAMAPGAYLDARPGEYILDLCAAPGGKSTQIAASMRGQGLLVSNEIHPGRARILSENIERMGITNCMVTNESPQTLTPVFAGFFDGIMVDAPCSGEGMFRKNEEACEEWSLQNVKLCAERQLEILSCAAHMLKPGGRIVYSTCTFAPEENEGTLDAFLRLHPDFFIEKRSLFPGMTRGVPAWANSENRDIENSIRLFPHHARGEGHFLCVLRREGPLSAPGKTVSAKGTEPGISEKDCRSYTEFKEQYIKEMPDGKLILFGEQLYLCPSGLPGLKGLKVLRPGLHLGTIKKNRFEPAHALALALSEKDVRYSCDLDSGEDEVRSYLNGQTLTRDGQKGWYLITVDHYSLGWGKLAGNMIKNHYPKGLRINY